MGEFELISRYFHAPFANFPNVGRLIETGIGDDCAVLTPLSGRLVISTDTCVSGAHFPVDTSAEMVAARSLGSSVSDLAAMGAEPVGFTLALTLPTINEAWLQAFGSQLYESALAWRIPLIGGDTTKGPLAVTVTVLGRVQDQCLYRHGAAPGEDVWVSGSLGDAAAALSLLGRPDASLTPIERWLYQRYASPQPRLRLGSMLRGIATAAIDISDGLIADLAHICSASNCGALIEEGAIPLSPALLATFSKEEALNCALEGGDDYELCFTAPQSTRDLIQSLSADVALSRIGTLRKESGVSMQRRGEEIRLMTKGGYDHFKESSVT
ncbi:thiamine-monophosphate kinase [Hahella chejuensis KCTC 2396]|uniref:Thiamine-monophosphate kinase n=1 Tax=Hahella chejuensis (strain KCTC 2396) TaxID=349521 RepID=Q2S9S1_HAHCH|nr:thiamine-phosphate kinase [Hahella chejuensis]ABC32603.1 thiamine-monophosphate kinase [Hahella chejuensis KCTC 2396]